MGRVKEAYMQEQECKQNADWLEMERRYEMKEEYMLGLEADEANRIFDMYYAEIVADFGMTFTDFTCNEIFDMEEGKVTPQELAIAKGFIVFEDLSIIDMAYVIKEQGKRA